MALVSPPYPHRMSAADVDLQDHRYPSHGSSSNAAGNSVVPFADRAMNTTSGRADFRGSWLTYPSPHPNSYQSNSWMGEQLTEEPVMDPGRDMRSSPATSQQAQQYTGPDNTLSYTLSPIPAFSPRLAADRRYSREDLRPPRMSTADSGEPNRVLSDPSTASQNQDMGQRSSGLHQASIQASNPRHSTLSPVGGVAVGSSSSTLSPAIPPAAGPSYNPPGMQIPIAPKPRAYAQHPTYVNPQSPPQSMNPVYTPPPPKEEVCVECAMRDQDMADVDVTSPGAWERESDAAYEDLCRMEEEEEAMGIVYDAETPSRPRSKGSSLSQENLQYWLSINPKEPSSRQQNLDMYVKAQRSLLEAEALAHARAMRESRQLDDRMRDTYSQLRRSAYESGSSAQPIDDIGAVRIKVPRPSSSTSPSGFNTAHSPTREVTLLENGMIVEHVDVRKEEKEERERKRKEERRERSRVRKSSRSSAVDATSVYSMPVPSPSPIPNTDSGFFSGSRTSDARYSQSLAARPSSVLTAGNERPQSLLREYSQASFSDMQSVGSASPRRSRFLGLRNLSTGWRSQDSLAPSGSMIDMHVALQREQQYYTTHPMPADMASITPTLRADEDWRRISKSPEGLETIPAIKKKTGFKKIWRLVTGGSSKHDMQPNRQARSLERPEDDTPLAPPPPLSYLVDRERGLSQRRHLSTPSLPSSVSPNTQSPHAASPPTAPSSLLPSPTSSRPLGAEVSGPDNDNLSDTRKDSGNHESDHERLQASGDASVPESESRGRTTQNSSRTLSTLGPATPNSPPASSNRPLSVAMRRDKSLPPIPGESSVAFPNHATHDGRPQTVFTYDPRQMTLSVNPTTHGLLPPQAPFRTAEMRRQSFGGMASGPHPAVKSMPAKGAFGVTPPFFGEEYGEFGASRMSLGNWEATQRHDAQPQKPKKRQSRFGLSSLFGKKSRPIVPKVMNGDGPVDYPTIRSSVSDPRHDEGGLSGYGGSASHHSSTAPRMSIMSRKNLAELVDQDPEFVAYRYPSNDQRLDLLR